MPLRARLAAALALTLVFATGCGETEIPADGWGTVVIAPGAAIPLGVSTALSGGVSGLGGDIRDGALLAIRDRPELAGHQLQAMVEDDRCDEGESVAVAQKFTTSAAVVAVVGPMCSGGALQASDVYEAAHVTMITPSATAPLVTSRNMATVFRVAWNDRVQGAGQAEFALADLGAPTAVVVHDDTMYGQSLADLFVANYEAAGGKALAIEQITRGQIDFIETVEAIRVQDPAIVVFAGFTPEGTLLVRQIRAAGLAVPVLAGDGVQSRRDFIEAAEGAADGVYVSGGSTRQGPVYDDFAVRFAEAYGREPGLFAAQSFDATATIVDALQRIAVAQDDGSLVIGRKALNDAIRLTKREGASGQIEFGGDGDREFAADVSIYRVEGDDFLLVREVMLQPPTP